MKSIQPLVLLSLAMPLGLSLSPGRADETNPYLARPAQRAPAAPVGNSFLTLTEHVLVPSNLLESWLAGHSMAKDASELRAAAQKWIEDGRASIASTALVAGTVGRDFSNESIVEQIYATEYEPPLSPEDWPTATAFETRNLGYMIEGNAVREQGDLVVRSQGYFVKMLPHHAYDLVSEKTRQPDDIFIPTFRSFMVSQSSPAPAGRNPNDPFADHRAFRVESSVPSYPEGKVHLALRVDEDLPEPSLKWPLESKPEDEAADPLPEDRTVRLIFVRSNKTDSPPESREPLPANYQLSVRLVSVDHGTLSAWLQERDLTAASKELEDAIETWHEDDKVKEIKSLSGGERNGPVTTLQDIKKLEYPTEYEPGKREPTPDGKSTQTAFATGESIETRNLGTTLATHVSAESGGPVINVSLDRVLLGGYSVHHRTLRDGEWMQDITFPRFATNRWRTSLRIQKGEWAFAGSGSGFDEKGQIDPSRTVLAFVKAD